MDRHPQQIKRERQDKKRRLNNVALMSKLKTSIKKILSMSDQKEAKTLYRNTVKQID